MVKVYSKPNCVQCKMTYKELDKQGIKYEVIDMLQDDEALAHVKGLGYLSAPVVEAGTSHWAGFRPDLIASI